MTQPSAGDLSGRAHPAPRGQQRPGSAAPDPAAASAHAPAGRRGQRGRRARWRVVLGTAGSFLRQIWDKAGADDIFFLAAAVAFNVLVAFVPLVLAALGMAGFILRQSHANPTRVLLHLVQRALPALTPAQEHYVENILHGLLQQSTSFLSIGTLLLVWFATRLIGTLRTTLKSVFDLAAGRGIIAGKIFDIQMVFATGVLFTLNVGVTVALRILASLGMNVLGLHVAHPNTFQRVSLEAVAFIPVWTMFLLIYHFLPLRRTKWSVSIIAATFTAIFFEVLKAGFSWYVVHLANYSSMYGNLATLVVIGLWIYYSSVVFILGGEVAQVWAMRRIRRHQKERLE